MGLIKNHLTLNNSLLLSKEAFKIQKEMYSIFKKDIIQIVETETERIGDAERIADGQRLEALRTAADQRTTTRKRVEAEKLEWERIQERVAVDRERRENMERLTRAMLRYEEDRRQWGI